MESMGSQYPSSQEFYGPHGIKLVIGCRQQDITPQVRSRETLLSPVADIYLKVPEEKRYLLSQTPGLGLDKEDMTLMGSDSPRMPLLARVRLKQTFERLEKANCGFPEQEKQAAYTYLDTQFRADPYQWTYKMGR